MELLLLLLLVFELLLVRTALLVAEFVCIIVSVITEDRSDVVCVVKEAPL